MKGSAKPPPYRGCRIGVSTSTNPSPSSQRRISATKRERAIRSGRDADDVAEIDVHRPGTCLLAEELDAARTIDQVEKGELAVPAARHHAPGQAPLLIRLLAGLEFFRLGSNQRDVVPVGKPLRQHGPRVYSAPDQTAYEHPNWKA